MANSDGSPCNGCHDYLYDAGDAGESGWIANGTAFANIALHMDGAFTPIGGGGGDCTGCHVQSADVDNFASDGTKAMISDTEWTARGHGGTILETNKGAGVACWWCHDKNESEHFNAMAGTINPFRLKGKQAGIDNSLSGGDEWNYACLICHSADESGSYDAGESDFTAIDRTAGADMAARTKIDKWHFGAAHDQSGTNNDKGGQFCWDCHDPHGDASNILMIQRHAVRDHDGLTGHPGVLSNLTGGGPPVGNAIVFTVNSATTAVGSWAMNTTDGGGATFDQGLCNACHTNSASNPKMEHYYRTGSDDHNNAATCRSCHKHSKDSTNDGNAFKGEGESGGGESCETCHFDFYSSDEKQATMHGRLQLNGVTIADKINYKHYMQNDGAIVNATWGSKYPTDLTTSSADNIATTSSGENVGKRRCLMCHGDHDVFRTGAGGNPLSPGRAYNMRVSIQTIPNPSDTTTFTNTDFDRTRPDGGICISCHFKERNKFLTTPNDATKTPPIPLPLNLGNDTANLANAVEMMVRSTHSYSVDGALFKGPDGSETSFFKGVCVKCHNDTIGTNFGPKNIVEGQDTEGTCFDAATGLPIGGATSPRLCDQSGGFWNGTVGFGRHISSNDSSLAVMGTKYQCRCVHAVARPDPARVEQRPVGGLPGGHHLRRRAAQQGPGHHPERPGFPHRGAARVPGRAGAGRHVRHREEPASRGGTLFLLPQQEGAEQEHAVREGLVRPEGHEGAPHQDAGPLRGRRWLPQE
jgi:hypothetical protein